MCEIGKKQVLLSSKAPLLSMDRKVMHCSQESKKSEVKIDEKVKIQKSR